MGSSNFLSPLGTSSRIDSEKLNFFLVVKIFATQFELDVDSSDNSDSNVLVESSGLYSEPDVTDSSSVYSASDSIIAEIIG